jgi:hypothetical protein
MDAYLLSAAVGCGKGFLKDHSYISSNIFKKEVSLSDIKND